MVCVYQSGLLSQLYILLNIQNHQKIIYIINENCLQNDDLEVETESKDSPPNVLKIALLKKAIELYEARDHNKAFLECAKCIHDRPFHPEAYLQLVEIVLELVETSTLLSKISSTK